MHESCVFCDIRSEPYRIINPGALVTSFLSAPRMAKGHVLIVPNKHRTLPGELSDEEVLATHREADRITEIMLSAGGIAIGVDRWQKSRPAASEGKVNNISHVHTHVIPSSPGQPIYGNCIEWGGSNWTDLTRAEAAEMIALFR